MVFAADGEAGSGDLFASSSAGGVRYQITFTRLDERLPALSPDGTMLAFVRSSAPGHSRERWLVVMNLLNGAERRTEIEGAVPDALAWAPDGTRIYLRVGGTVRASPAPPGDLAIAGVGDVERAAADSALTVLLGDPPFGTAVNCDGGGICVRLGGDSLATVAAAGSVPTRWSGDSIAYFESGAWVIRPLAGGRTRVLRWSVDAPTPPRELTLFPGRARR